MNDGFGELHHIGLNKKKFGDERFGAIIMIEVGANLILYINQISINNIIALWLLTHDLQHVKL